MAYLGMFEPTSLLVFGITFVLSMLAQGKVKMAYAKYSKVGVRSGVTGLQVAQQILREYDIDDVTIEMIPGQMTDHYDPRNKALRLSQDVYAGQSIASLGIAAHEVGHAIQHAYGYAPLEMRSLVYPMASFGEKLAFPLIFIGLFLANIPWLANLGILLFAVSVAFTLITLPVEFNASSRAVRALADGGMMTAEELGGTKSVLNAAALTYVAAAASSVMWLLYYVMISNNRN